MRTTKLLTWIGFTVFLAFSGVRAGAQISPGALGFSASTYSVAESGALAMITVQRTGGSDGVVTADFSTADGSAIGGLDYLPQSGTLVFAPGETSKTFTVPIIDDLLADGNKTVNLTLVNPTGGATLGVPANAVLTIVDDEVSHPGALSFSAGTYSVTESGVTATITVQRTGGSDGLVSVGFATTGGSAINGVDYIPRAGIVVFAPGETSQTFTVPIIDDLLADGNKTVNLTLSNPTGGAVLGVPSIAVLTIVDDEVSHPGALSFSAGTYSVTESGATATITVQRTGGSEGLVTADFGTADGSAIGGLDYLPQSGTLVFAPGETSRTFTIPIVDDLLIDGKKTVNLSLSNPTGGVTLGAPTAAVLTIVDNDAPMTIKQQALAELTALRATVTDKDDGKKLDEAIEHLTKSLAAEWWVDASHLERKHGEKVFDEEKHAVKKLCELIKDKHSSLPAAVLQGFIDRMFQADRQLASIAINEAVAAGVAKKKIDQARKDLAKGDAETGDGKCENGIEDYKNAWKHAARAKVSPPAPPSHGKMRLELAGEPGERITVQASTDLLNWVTLGTWTIGRDGTATAEDADAGKYPARYYRLMTP